MGVGITVEVAKIFASPFPAAAASPYCFLGSVNWIGGRRFDVLKDVEDAVLVYRRDVLRQALVSQLLLFSAKAEVLQLHASYLSVTVSSKLSTKPGIFCNQCRIACGDGTAPLFVHHEVLASI